MGYDQKDNKLTRYRQEIAACTNVTIITKKIGSLESEKSGPYRFILGT